MRRWRRRIVKHRGAAWRQSMAASNGGKRKKTGDSAEMACGASGGAAGRGGEIVINNGGGEMAWRRRKREINIAAKWRREWWLSQWRNISNHRRINGGVGGKSRRHL
jgi:hypothetical protein